MPSSNIINRMSEFIIGNNHRIDLAYLTDNLYKGWEINSKFSQEDINKLLSNIQTIYISQCFIYEPEYIYAEKDIMNRIINNKQRHIIKWQIKKPINSLKEDSLKESAIYTTLITNHQNIELI